MTWLRCRRCARRLKSPEAVKAGIGPECASKPDPLNLNATVRTMRAVDYILDNLHATLGMRVSAGLAKEQINAGRRIRPMTMRLLLQDQETLQRRDHPWTSSKPKPADPSR